MNNQMRGRLSRLVVVLVCMGNTAIAGAVYDITIDTSSLAGHAAQPFSLAFQLTDGSGVGNLSSNVRVTNLDLGNGSSVGTSMALGGTTGDLSVGLNLSDSTFLNAFIQRFTPGNFVKFRLNLVFTPEASETPDHFSFSILDNSGVSIPTRAGTPVDVLGSLDFVQDLPVLQVFAGDTSRSPVGGGGPIDLVTPIAELLVVMDIKPGETPNSINPRQNGRVPVAILSVSGFHARSISVNTIRFGRTGTEASPSQSALTDVNRDGKLDLLLHFRTQESGIRCGDITAVLTGTTTSGMAIKGADRIRTVSCR